MVPEQAGRCLGLSKQRAGALKDNLDKFWLGEQPDKPLGETLDVSPPLDSSKGIWAKKLLVHNCLAPVISFCRQAGNSALFLILLS